MLRLTTLHFDRKSEIAIKYKKNGRKDIWPIVNETFKKLFPEFEYEIMYHDERIKNLYKKEEKVSVTFGLGSIISIIISMFGLFSLSFFVSRMKIKEFGIRKVFGAHSKDVVYSIIKELFTFVLAGTILSFPVAYFIMNKWLQKFVYKTKLSLWIFAAAGLLAIILALLTASYQAYKASKKNPIDSLRYE